jgi:threonine dehydrogenase-like Zn-dependent dehydrogenase
MPRGGAAQYGSRMRQLTLIEPHRLDWLEVDDPERKDDRDALVRPLAVATCDLDAPIIAGRTPYPPPIAVGHECVAEVVEAADGGPERGALVSVPFQISCGECSRCRRGLTGNCESVPFLSMYGFGSFGGDWGGFLSDVVRVPFSDHMLSPLPDGVSAEAAASVSDNIVDGWRLVAPGLEQWPDGEVLVAGGSPSVGLYGVQIALALGAARVVYCDVDDTRLQKAEELGAEVVAGYPERLGPFPITAMVSSDPAALALAARSTAPDGICTCAGIVFKPETPIPLLEMYTKITTFRAGRPHARPTIPRVLELMADGRLRPEVITDRVLGWDDAPDALGDNPGKLIFSRSR